jgi:hypothetical protein
MSIRLSIKDNTEVNSNIGKLKWLFIADFT